MPCDAPAAAPPRPTAQSSPLRVRCVVKLGGAACTVKAGVNELDGGALDAAARQLALGAAQFPSPSPVPFVVVHGAGSFGHPQARAMLGEARGAAGWSLAARKHAAETAAAVRQLNAAVVSALCAEGVPAAGVSPLPLGWTARTAAFAYRHALEPLLRAGLTPVVHGDVVLDPEAGDSAGATILSGDVIAARAAEAFAADFCVFLTDVSGVFDRPPRLPGAVRRRRVSAAEARRPVLQPTAVHAHAALSAMGPADLGRRKERGGVVDVTGGMAAKLQWAAEAAGKGADVYICKVGTEAARQALNGTVHRVARETGETPPDWEGTWVVSEGR